MVNRYQIQAYRNQNDFLFDFQQVPSFPSSILALDTSLSFNVFFHDRATRDITPVTHAELCRRHSPSEWYFSNVHSPLRLFRFFDRWYEALSKEYIWHQWMLDGLVKNMDIPTRNTLAH